jgi:hypothetical protein
MPIPQSAMQPVVPFDCAFVPHAGYSTIAPNFCQGLGSEKVTQDRGIWNCPRITLINADGRCPRSGERASRFRIGMRGSAPPLNPPVELSDGGVADHIPIRNRDACFPRPPPFDRYETDWALDSKPVAVGNGRICRFYGAWSQFDGPRTTKRSPLAGLQAAKAYPIVNPCFMP